MTEQTISSRAATLGPFLSLLVVMTSRRSREADAEVRSQPADLSREEMARFDRFQQMTTGGGLGVRSQAVTLGPFFTLIVTLRCPRAVGRSGRRMWRFRQAVLQTR
jgi:hypothetical protein